MILLDKTSSPISSTITFGKSEKWSRKKFYQGLWGQFIKEAKTLLLFTLLNELHISEHYADFTSSYLFTYFYMLNFLTDGKKSDILIEVFHP